MKKEFVWNIKVDGTRHEIQAVDRGNAFDVYVDGEFRFPVRSDINLDVEEDLTVGTKRCRIVVYRGVPDLAVDGILMDADAKLLKEEKRNRRYTILGGLLLVFLGTYAMFAWITLKVTDTYFIGGNFAPVFAIGAFVAGLWLLSRAFRKRAY
jgi:hypothetical protein